MKRLVQGSVIRIPLLHDLGYAYAKYINLLKISNSVSFPEIIKVYDSLTHDPITHALELNTKTSYLISPILIAGLRPTLKDEKWVNIGKVDLSEGDTIIPDFKDNFISDPDLSPSDVYLIKSCSLQNKTLSNQNDTRFLQHFLAEGTGNIEIKLTMYFLLKDGKNLAEFFDIEGEEKRNYNLVKDAMLISN